MQFRQITDKKRWNDFVYSNESLDILQSWEWGELKKIEGWEPYRFMVEGFDEILIGGMVLVKKYSGLGSLAYIPHGPAFHTTPKASYDGEMGKIWGIFEQGLISWAKTMGVFSIELEPKLLVGVDSYVAEVLKNPKWKITGRNRQAMHKLNLNIVGSEEEIMAGMSKGTRYNIRYALKSGVEFKKYSLDDKNIDAVLDRFYSLVLEMQDRAGGYHVRSKEYFKRLVEIYKSTGRMQFMEVSYEGDVIAMNISQFTDTWASSFYAGSNRLHSKVRAPYLLRWESIKEAKKRGCKVYDFWGVILNSKQHAGYSKNKMGYGGDQKNSLGIFEHKINWKGYLWSVMLKMRSLF